MVRSQQGAGEPKILANVIPSAARDLQLRVEKRYYVYIMASRSRNLYTGVTNSLYSRVLDHKSGKLEGFTKRYRIVRLVYYETYGNVGEAIAREKQIKAWTRAKRLALIESMNPTWQDLAVDWGKPFKLQIPRGLEPARDDTHERVGQKEIVGQEPVVLKRHA